MESNLILNESATSNIKSNTSKIIAHLTKLYYLKGTPYARPGSWIGTVLESCRDLNEKRKLSDYDNLTDYDIKKIYSDAEDIIRKDNPNLNFNISVVTDYFGNDIKYYSDIDTIVLFLKDVVNDPEVTRLANDKVIKGFRAKKTILRK